MGISNVDVVSVQVMKKDGLEADARSARYAALNSCAQTLDARAIFLGHNQDDLAESVLLGLTQGSGTKSLAGMATHSGLYIRPFLAITREEVVNACVEVGIEYWSDPHNEDERFTRVKIRTQILPLMESLIGPGIKEALARSARIFREDSDALDLLSEEIFTTIPDPTKIEVVLLEKLPVALRKRVIRRAISRLGANRISAEQLDWVDALISDWHGQGAVALPAGVTARRESGRLALSRE
ncbi:MAG: tRNA lysidine(34) synthetase TilS [Actinobacteria bacterium]|uniref:tRNA(Ile)-lysidine synthetase n=1 Tax=Candidatus Fonsibacter lacus TaxID=2576439 RepID=A0A965LKI5_9PROT|nr:tRNA lysidine(34) synthetase TilS [Candidatus Fonsibacter lacus]